MSSVQTYPVVITWACSYPVLIPAPSAAEAERLAWRVSLPMLTGVTVSDLQVSVQPREGSGQIGVPGAVAGKCTVRRNT